MVIQLLKGSMIQAPSGYVYVRPDDNSAMKDVAVGFSKNLAEYAFPVWDPDRVMVFPIRSVTAPADWPKIVTRLGSPPNAAMFFCTQRSAAN